MKRLIFLLFLLVFITACSSIPYYGDIKDTLTFKNRYTQIGTSIPRGIEIQFVEGLPKNTLASGEYFDVAGIITNNMPPSTSSEVPVEIKLTSSEAGKLPKTNFETVQKSLSVESAFLDENQNSIDKPGIGIVSSDFEMLGETAFKLGSFFYSLEYNKNIDLILDYTYPVSAVFSTPFCLRKPYAPGVNCQNQESVSESNLGIFAKTIPITVEKIEKNILPTTDPDQIKLDLTFYVKDKGISGLSILNENALVNLEIASLSGYKDLRDVTCKTNDNKHQGNSRIKFKLTKGSSIITCSTLFRLEEDAVDFHLKVSLDYSYNTRLVKTLKIEGLPKNQPSAEEF